MPAVAVRQVERLNQKDPEAAPIVTTERFDPATGERITDGWRRRNGGEYPNFTIPAPAVRCIGLDPAFAKARPGRYLVFANGDGRALEERLADAGAEIIL